MKQKRLEKRFAAWFLGLALVANLPMFTAEAEAGVASTAQLPSVTTFATREELANPNNFTLYSEYGTGVAQKVNFGNEKTWYIAGAQQEGTELVLICDPDTEFEEHYFCSYYVDTTFSDEKDWGIYETPLEPGAQVWFNHYGQSAIREYVKSLYGEKNVKYFTAAEKQLMKNTKVYTWDYVNERPFYTTDKLYLAYGVDNEKSITVGANESGNSFKELDNGIRIGLNQNGPEGSPFIVNSKRWFWVRTGNKLYGKNVNDAVLGRSVMISEGKGEFSVIPVCNLDMSNLLFASGAVASTDGATLSDAMTLRYNAGCRIRSELAVGTDSVTVTKQDGDAGDIYLYVQGNDGSDWVYTKLISGTEEITASTIHTGADLSKCKIWLEMTDDNVTYARTLSENSDVHFFVSDCAVNCSVCGYERTEVAASHEYSSDCAAYCSSCGYERIPTEKHVFLNSYKMPKPECLVCGEENTNKCGEGVYYIYDAETGCLAIYGSGAMENYISGESPFGPSKLQAEIKEVQIFPDVKTIGDYAFSGCDKLTKVTIPDSVTSIGEAAFAGCDSLLSFRVPCVLEKSADHWMAGCSAKVIWTHKYKVCPYVPGEEGKHTCTVCGLIESHYFGRESLYDYCVCNVKNINFSGLSIAATDVYYTGTEQIATITGLDASKYDVTNNIQTDGGTYTLTLTGKDDYAGTRTITWNILRYDPTYTVPTEMTASYGDTLGDVELPAAENGTWSWKDGATTSVGNIGTNTFVAVFTPTDIARYYEKEENVDIVVSKAASTIAFKDYAPGKVYDGKMLEYPTEDQLVLTGATYSDLDFQWYIEYDGVNSEFFGMPEDAGYYYLVVTVGESENTSSATVTSEKITIEKKTLSLEEIAAKITKDLSAVCGSELLSVSLPAEFQWTDSETSIIGGEAQEGQTITRKAKYSPADFKNYEVVDDVALSIVVSHDFSVPVASGLKCSGCEQIKRGEVEFTAQPKDVTVAANAKATFSVATTGEGLTYKWEKSTDGGNKWVAMAGTTDTRSINAVTENMNGWKFRVKVTDKYGFTAVSDAATLTVTALPVITANLKDVVVEVDMKATFGVTATGEELTYKWEKSTDGGKKWVAMAGTTNTRSISSVTENMNGWKFRVKVTDKNGGMVISDVATLTVEPASQLITDNLTDVSVAVGGKAIFSVTATGEGLTYKWEKSTDGGKKWVAMAGTTNARAINTVTANMNGWKFRVIVTNKNGKSETSDVATLIICGPVITEQLKDVTVAVGAKATFSVTATGEGLTYKWEKSTNGGKTWVAMAGTTNTRSISSVAASYNGWKFRVIITDKDGNSAISNAATLTVR